MAGQEISGDGCGTRPLPPQTPPPLPAQDTNIESIAPAKLRREIKEDLKIGKAISYSWFRRLGVVKMSIIPQTDL